MAVPIKACFIYLNLSNIYALHPILIELTSKIIAGLDISFQGHSFIFHLEGWAQDCSNSNIFLKPLFRGKFDPFVNNANLGAIAHTSNGT